MASLLVRVGPDTGVLSASTEAYDREEKFRPHRLPASLAECALVAGSRPDIELYTRSAHFWAPGSFGLEDELELVSVRPSAAGGRSLSGIELPTRA